MQSYSIDTPREVWRHSIGRRSVFITKETEMAIRSFKEYGREMSKARAAREGEQGSGISASENIGTLWIALEFMSRLAVKENAFLSAAFESNSTLKATDQTLQKCRRDTVVALAFLYRETSESKVILQDVGMKTTAIFANRAQQEYKVETQIQS